MDALRNALLGVLLPFHPCLSSHTPSTLCCPLLFLLASFSFIILLSQVSVLAQKGRMTAGLSAISISFSGEGFWKTLFRTALSQVRYCLTLKKNTNKKKKKGEIWLGGKQPVQEHAASDRQLQRWLNESWSHLKERQDPDLSGERSGRQEGETPGEEGMFCQVKILLRIFLSLSFATQKSMTQNQKESLQ